MNFSSLVARVGTYVVTPHISSDESGAYRASVSVRRGSHDRIFRFSDRFSSGLNAAVFAAQQGRQLVLGKQLG